MNLDDEVDEEQKSQFHQYCRETRIPPFIWLPLVYMGGVLVTYLLGACFARL